MNRLNTLLLLCFVACLSLYSTEANAYESIALGGTWRFDIDKSAKGVGEGWEKGHQYTLTINLPGTMDQANFGTNPPKADINNQYTFGWSRPKIYEGVAWYEREVEIPAAWAGKRVELFLEQLRSESTVWIDGKKISPTEESLLTSHRHDLTQLLTPGKHRLTIMLDNSNKRGIGGSYVRSSMGQGNWQGIVGDIELRASDKVWIEHVRFEAMDERRGEITVTLGNTSGNTAKAKGEVRFSDGGEIVAKSSFTVDVSPGGGTQKVNIDISQLECWSQFVPQLYDLEVEMQAGGNSDKYSERTGVRTVGRNTNNQFMVNGTTTFLRGTVCYNIFPITGYPSTELDDWLKIFRTYQEWGMNHVRFHSLTPPKAAFQAADILGIYLQSEYPKAGIVGKVAEDDAFQIAEGHRILRDYGNHPSFILMSMGNELAGEKASISRVFNELSSADNRRLYTTTTGGASLEYKDDFKIYGGIVRGFKGPQTDWDYKAVIEPMDVTVISHEVGQWHVYPDVSIIPKFTGVMKADNLQYIHDDLKERGMLDMAHDFTQVTGAFALQLYKEEMEAITRTPNFGGFQILMLNDFPAQGTATCGMIDIFNDLKGYALPHQFREFVAPIVPLARMPKRVYTSSETFTAQVDLANYTQSAIRNGKLLWTLQDGEKVFYRGEIASTEFPVGNVFEVGQISTPLAAVDTSRKLELVITLEGSEYRNRWNIWVYPEQKTDRVPPKVKVTTKWPEAKKMLAAGEKVLFLPSNADFAMWRPGQFKSIFWGPVWLKRGVETMSVIADVKHPALGKFPTERNTDWQWFDVLENSYVFALDRLPSSYKPIVYVVDGFRKNQRLTNLMEAKVGKGSLMISTIDFVGNLDKDLARANLRRSVLEYMASEHFDPSQRLSVEELEKMFDRVVETSRELFPAISQAALHIKADGTKVKSEAGYSFRIDTKVSKSGDISAWADKRDLWVHVKCPEAQGGTLFLFMRNSSSGSWGHLKTPQEVSGVDWVEETMVNYGNRNSNPVAAFIINNRYIETIHDFGVTGKWFSLPVSAAQMKNGELNLQISTLNVPNILTEFAFVKSR